MLKYFIVSLLVSYILRKYLFPPINQNNNQSTSQAPREEPKKSTKKFTDNLGEYTDYEEIK